MRTLPTLIVSGLLLFTNVLLAQELVKPFQTHNQNPLVHFFGLPTNPGGQILGKSEFVFENYLNIANNATSTQLEAEAIYLDGEMYKNEIFFKYGLFSKLELSLLIPLVQHSRGIMDPFISGWHKIFGLPGSAREGMEDHKLTYLYLENEQAILFMDESELTIGDISFSLSTPLYTGKRNHIALRSFYKMASGKKSNLTGSGTHDFGVQVTGSIEPVGQRKITWFYSGGYLRIGKGAMLSDLVAKNVGFGSLGMAYNINNRFVPKAQLDFHSAFYKNSNLKQLGKESVQLVLGLDYYISNRFSLTGAFVEDIIVNTAPDFVLQFGISYQFK